MTPSSKEQQDTKDKTIVWGFIKPKQSSLNFCLNLTIFSSSTKNRKTQNKKDNTFSSPLPLLNKNVTFFFSLVIEKDKASSAAASSPTTTQMRKETRDSFFSALYKKDKTITFINTPHTIKELNKNRNKEIKFTLVPSVLVPNKKDFFSSITKEKDMEGTSFALSAAASEKKIFFSPLRKEKDKKQPTFYSMAALKTKPISTPLFFFLTFTYNKTTCILLSKEENTIFIQLAKPF